MKPWVVVEKWSSYCGSLTLEWSGFALRQLRLSPMRRLDAGERIWRPLRAVRGDAVEEIGDDAATDGRDNNTLFALTMILI